MSLLSIQVQQPGKSQEGTVINTYLFTKRRTDNDKNSFGEFIERGHGGHCLSWP